MYFFGRMDARKAVMVYLISLVFQVSLSWSLHQVHGYLQAQFLLLYIRPLSRTIVLFAPMSQLGISLFRCILSCILEGAINRLDSVLEGFGATWLYLEAKGRTLSKSLLISRGRLHPS